MLSPGTKLGRYEIRAQLGAGGMGEVYLGYDQDLDRDVAIKVIRDGRGDVHRFVQEAKAASALNHPNVAHVYEIGSQDNLRFIAMEIVEGETLRDRIARGPLPPDDALDIALQITAALAAAHQHGIVHRDIKPENVMLRPDGYAKVLDFGLAKLRDQQRDDAATVVRTATGIAMGTIGYMAPEQFSAGEITAASDVYAVGVVLYEMISGVRPEASGPRPQDVPPKLNAVVKKALAPSPSDRYPSAVEMHEELRSITRENRVGAAAGRGAPLRWIAMVVIVVAAAFGFWAAVRSKRTKEARQHLARGQQLYAQHNTPAAYAEVMQAAPVIPDDDKVIDLITKVSQKVSIKSDPPGAIAYARYFKGPPERTRLGTTPIDLPRMMRADYLITMEKPGYAPATRPLSIGSIWWLGLDISRQPGTLQIKLVEASKAPANMVFVAGAPYQLQGWYRASDRKVNLRDFFIDRYEVSNRDYAEFIRAGGYRSDPDLAHDVDATGLPGPRTWSGGAPPAGFENHPVSGVTWSEAASYCKWKGKKLPTIFQWERAGRYPGTRGALTTFPWGYVAEGVDVTERANFLGKGTVPVDGMPFGMSTWGAENMAGNVSEWVRNEKPPGHAARGGSWNDATYAFGQTASFPKDYASATLGFRCAQSAQPGDEGDFALSEKGFIPVYHAVDSRTYEELRKRYDYTPAPLSDARVIETIDAPDWKREKIAFTVEGRTVIAYLYLPRGFKPPFQVIHFSPAGDVENGLRSLASSIEAKLPAQIRSGRAIFAVAMEGYIDRPRKTPFEEPDSRSDEYVDYVVDRVTELRRGLDYLVTRPEIDPSRIVFEADSAGTWAGVILAAVETRYRSLLFVGTGIEPTEGADAAAANRINFAAHITAPKLMLQGRYDESSPFASEFEPLYQLMPQPKRLVVYEGPHVPPAALYIRESQKWFDETMGKVGR